MKILIIYPYFLEARVHEDEIRVPPHGVYYVAAMLKENGYDVDVLNWYEIHKTPDVVSNTLRTINPDIIGFSVLHANRWGAIEIARVAKKINPDVHVVFGGIGATYLWKHFLKHFPEIDTIVIGEGEAAFLDLVQTLERGEPDRIASIKGLALQKNGIPYLTPCRAALRDLDELPNPAGYFTYQHLSLTRGCPGKCTFCGSPRFWGRSIRSHSADYFVDELEQLHTRGISFFHVSDDTFTLNKKRVISVCREICKRRLNIQWAAISRVDCVDEKVLLWMRKAGCIQISYGVESGAEEIRKRLKKNFSEAQIETTFALTTRYGMLARAYFIYGCPGETDATIQATIDLMRRIKPLSAIFYILDIFPGTDLYDDYRKKTGMDEDVWLNRIEDILYYETDPELTEDQVLMFGKKLREAFYINLPEFIDRIELVERDDLNILHADFLSRLAMTFDHGDYAAVDSIRGKADVADRLYRRALAYAPDARAFLGLGMSMQKKRELRSATELIDRGLDHFPDNEQLNVCQAINHMNSGEFKKALDRLLPFRQSPHNLPTIAECYRQLGEPAKADEIMQRLLREP